MSSHVQGTTITEHAFSRMQERLSIQPPDICRMLDEDRAVQLGYQQGSLKCHYLLYSEPDDDYFVLIRDEKTREIISVLPLGRSYFRVSSAAEDTAKELALRVDAPNIPVLQPEEEIQVSPALPEEVAQEDVQAVQEGSERFALMLVFLHLRRRIYRRSPLVVRRLQPGQHALQAFQVPEVCVRVNSRLIAMKHAGFQLEEMYVYSLDAAEAEKIICSVEDFRVGSQ